MSDPSREQLESPVTKLLPLVSIVVSLVLSTILLSLRLSGWSDTNFLRTLYFEQHAVLSSFVQVFSALLAYLQLFATFSAFEFWTRTKFTKNTTSLGKLRFWIALRNRHIDPSLPFSKLMSVVAVVIIAAIPASLWAGALSPQPSSSQYHDKSLIAPILGVIPNIANWNYWVARNSLGTFTPDVAQHFSSNVLLDASRAMDPNRTISRLDNTQIVYNGRSYGVGASVGLTDQELSDADYLQGYSYYETGFETSVDCHYNETTTWALKLVTESIPVGPASAFGNIPATFSAQYNNFSNNTSNYATWGYGSGYSIVAWNAIPPTVPGFIDMTAGVSYKSLDNISCSVTFEPTTFLVTVDKRLLTINVTAESPYNGVLDENLNLRLWALNQHSYISQNTQLPLVSTLGDCLYSNLNTSNSASQNLTAVAAAFTAMFDAIILATTSAQIQAFGFDSNSTLSKRVPVNATVSSIQLGDIKIIISLMVLNVCILLIHLFALVRTKFWADLSRFNYLDIAALIVASRIGAQSSVAFDGASGSRYSQEAKVGVSWKALKKDGAPSWVLQLLPGNTYAPIGGHDRDITEDIELGSLRDLIP